MRQPASGIEFSYEFDPAGRVRRVEQLTYGLRFTNQYTYDAFGRVVQRTFPDGEVYTHSYDGRRLAAIEGARIDIVMDAR